MGRACTAQEYVAGSGQRWPKKDASLVGEIDHGNSIVTNKLDDTCLNSINYSFVQQNWDGHYLCDRLNSTVQTRSNDSFFEDALSQHSLLKFIIVSQFALRNGISLLSFAFSVSSST